MIEFIKYTLYVLLEFLNKWPNKEEEKFVQSFIVDGVEAYNGKEWAPVAYIHQIRPEFVYYIKTTNGLELQAADDHLIFDDNMVPIFVRDLNPGDSILTINGVDTIQTIYNTGFERNLLDITVLNKTESYTTNDIISHNTTTSAIFLLHYICFNVDKNTLVLGNKRKTAIEILDKIKKIYFELPFFIKPGIYKWNEGEIVLDNGCRAMAEATTTNSGIGFTFHCVLADEFAHVPPNILDDFYGNLFPTVTAAKAKFIITSTQNGYNLFYRLYKAAEAGENDYKCFKTDWYEVPEWNPDLHQWEKRDEEWHQRQVANYGSEEAFNKQFGTSFDVSANTLISSRILGKKQNEIVEFIYKDLPGVPKSHLYAWHPDFEPAEQLKDSFLICTTDLSEGMGMDSSVVSFFRFFDYDAPKLECIGHLDSATISRSELVETLIYLFGYYCNPNHTLLSFEFNTYGELFLKLLYDEFDNNQIINQTGFGYDMVIKYPRSSNLEKPNYMPGVKINGTNKKAGCMLFKEAYEKGNIVNRSAKFFLELNNFTEHGDNKYEAAFGHDDIVMTNIQLQLIMQTLQVKIMKSEFEASKKLMNNTGGDISTTYFDF